ncbi:MULTISPECIES: hypothetical protein [Pantoea]|nr:MULTISPECIES: hypothetical protein [Pantoea]
MNISVLQRVGDISVLAIMPALLLLLLLLLLLPIVAIPVAYWLI